MTLLDWAPFEAHVHAWCGRRGADPTTINVATALGVTTQTIYRWRENGTVPVDTADELATSFGVHPTDVWGDDWFTDVDPWHLDPEWPSTDPEFLAAWASIDVSVMRSLLRRARGNSRGQRTRSVRGVA